jgi:hypothetical protein
MTYRYFKSKVKLKKESFPPESKECRDCPAGEMNGMDCIKDKNRECWLSNRRNF